MDMSEETRKKIEELLSDPEESSTCDATLLSTEAAEKLERDKKAFEETMKLVKGISEDVDEESEEKIPKGARDFMRLNLSQGFPIFETFVGDMIRHGNAPAREKKRMFNSLEKIAKKYGGGVGSRRIDFVDTDGKRRHCFIYMKRVDEKYDMGVEINKFKSVTSENLHDKFVDAIQDMMNFARQMYGGLSLKEETKLFDWSSGYLQEDVQKECFGVPKIDVLESTFYLREDWTHVGMYVDIASREESD